MIPSSVVFDKSVMTNLLNNDPVVQDYRAFFSLINWSVVNLWSAQRSPRGRPAHPESAYIKAFLVRIREGLIYATQLRRFLLKHPLLLIEIGFNLVLDPTFPFGFNCEETLPCVYWFRKKLQTVDQTLLQDLLHATVTDLQEEIPGLGETVAFDVKHIYGWVRENNPRVYVKGTFDVTRIPKGDPDCRLGVKKSSNQEQSDGSKKEKKESLFGYGSGVAACTNPVYGDVVLGEYTLSFNAADITHFKPLYQRTILALSQFPRNITADSAYDAWYVYECAARHGGIGAVPLKNLSKTPFARLADGTPRCPIGLPMHPTKQFNHTYGYRAQRFQCPLLFPNKTGETCEHEQFTKGKGCVKDVNWEQGGIMRVTLDRNTPLYKGILNQRTSCERINSQAKAWGIERPKVRNIRSVRNLNTFIYLVINVQAIERVKLINAGLLQMI
jgi:hypothetical protein